MNAEECAIVQRLISKLDDSRLFHRALTPHLRDAHARFLVSRLIDLNAAAADGLAQQMLLTGGVIATRGGRTLMQIRACAARWMVLASADRDIACLKRIARHGDRAMQGSQAVMARVRDLRQGHHRQLLTLERARFRIESLVDETGTWCLTNDTSPAHMVADALKQERFHR